MKLTTVLGKLSDTQKYIGLDGYNVLNKSDSWNENINLAFLLFAVSREDDFLLVSMELSGQYAKEVGQLIHILKNKNNIFVNFHHPCYGIDIWEDCGTAVREFGKGQGYIPLSEVKNLDFEEIMRSLEK